MYLQTKKVVIIFIVMIISFMSVITNLYDQAYNQNLNISIISSEELAFNNSYAQNIYSDINTIINEKDASGQHFNLNIYQINESSIQLENIVKSSDVNIIIGDSFNNSIVDIVNREKDKQFILVENSLSLMGQNIVTINTDYQKIFKQINQLTTDKQKSLVIFSNEYSNLALAEYYKSGLSSNENVQVINVEDTSDNVKVKSTILSGLKQGYTNVYSFDPYNNQILIETMDSYTASESDDVEVNYVALNNANVELANSYNSVNSFEYGATKEVFDVIMDMEHEELVSSSKTIVLSNSNAR